MSNILSCILIALSLVLLSSASGNAYSWGELVAGDKLMAKETINISGFFGTITEKEYIYQQVGAATPLLISYIKITDKKKFKGATAEVVSGGLQDDKVTIKFTSRRSAGIKSTIEIYGQ